MHLTTASRRWTAERGVLLTMLVSVLLLGGQARASDDGPSPSPLACPAGWAVWLEGTASPGRALLARFDGVAVGGGSAGADSAWRIPLTVNVPAGMYPVTVIDRQDHSQVAAFICYVGVPIGATPTATLTLRPTEPPLLRAPTATPTAGATHTVPRASSTAPPVVTETVVTEATPTMPFLTPTVQSSPSATGVAPSPTALPLTATATSTATPRGEALIRLVAAQADDPADPELWEYVILENQSAAPQTLTNWRLVHQATGEAYTFPVVTLLADEQLVVWSGAGVDEPATGTLFWPATSGRWAVGDTAALHRPDGQITSTLLVSASEDRDE